MTDLAVPRRGLLLAPLLAAVPRLLIGDAEASKLDPAQTMITPQDKIEWKTRPGWPKDSVAQANLFGDLNQTGLYYLLVKWYPGYMSAPHYYATDRLCVVVSGTWWVNSGADFDPASCVPVPTGSYIRRVAGTPHFDGVPPNGTEPVVIAICGEGPVKLTYLDPDQPGWRKV
ncbi:MAG: hypothetical protein QOJ54_1545 [Aliidongia sp.]|jgi:hypothetical protein|nr:hypothetical protein [Aliidongia sp.]